MKKNVECKCFTIRFFPYEITYFENYWNGIVNINRKCCSMQVYFVCFISEDQMNIRAENEFFQSGHSYWMHLLTRIVNNNGRYCLMSVLSLYFSFWYMIDDFTKKNEFFLPKSDRLIHLLISIVNNKCKYP